MSITTRRGDQGSTDLLFGHSVSKSHPRIHALGAVDELNAALGLVRVTAKSEIVQTVVPLVQMELIALMGELATPRGEEERYAKTHMKGIEVAHVERLDGLVAKLEEQGALKFEGWALPGAGGSLGGAHCDVARTVCRRAERSVMDLAGTEKEVPNREVVRYLNRLSDVLWLMARIEEKG
jgi:cob(I)alamin adenosyltransferase